MIEQIREMKVRVESIASNAYTARTAESDFKVRDQRILAIDERLRLIERARKANE